MNPETLEGVVEENGKFKVYISGNLVKSARMRVHAENFYAKATGGSAPKAVTTKPLRVAKAPRSFADVQVEPVSTVSVYVPPVDDGYIPFGDFRDIERIVKSEAFFPVFITGPSGNGKSTMVEQACARHGRKFIRLQLNRKTDEDQLIGTRSLQDGNIVIEEGPVITAMRTGAVLLLDEIDAGDPNEVMCLQSILEGKPFFFKLKNEMVYPARGFNIIATGNTKGRGSDSGKYIGTEMLNEAFLERFPVTICQEYPTPATEMKIVMAAMERHQCVDEKFADILIKWSDSIRRTYRDGALNDLITTRRLIQIVQSYSIFGNKMKSVQLACNRFDDETSTAFVSIFQKVSPEETPQEVAPIKSTKAIEDEEDIPF